MKNEIEYDYQILSDTKASIKDNTAEMARLLEDIINIKDELNNYWNGTAYNKFHHDIEAYKDEVEKMISIINDNCGCFDSYDTNMREYDRRAKAYLGK